MDFKDIATKVAELGLPVLGAALGGPAGAFVGKALAAAIGSPDEAPQDILKALTEDAATRANALRFEKEHELALVNAALRDRADARGREVQTKDNTNRVLAYTVLGSFVAVVGATLLGYAKVDSALAGTLIGYLSAKAEQVMGYYFGTTFGSLEKTRIMAEVKKA